LSGTDPCVNKSAKIYPSLNFQLPQNESRAERERYQVPLGPDKIATLSIWSSLKDLPVQMVLYQNEPNCFHTDL